MSIRIALLGVLQDGPKHGYEIKHIIEDHMGDWTNIAFGSIYFALKKLSEEGLIRKLCEEKDGNRPARSVYEITDSGRNEFKSLLVESWKKQERNFYEFDIALFFISYLKKDEVSAYISERILQAERQYEGLLRHYSDHENQNMVPPVAFEIINHTLEHMKAELKWLHSLKEKIDYLF